MTQTTALGEYIAHPKNGDGLRQTLREHLDGVSSLSSQFAAAFNESGLSYHIGQAHDLGKVRALWQERILQIEAGIKPTFVELLHDHKMSGAALVYPNDKLASLIIAGHHQGLPDFEKLKVEIESGKWDAHRQEVFEKTGCNFHASVQGDYFKLLMLYSCLVDADAIDTGSHAGERLVVPPFASMSELHDKLAKATFNSVSSTEVQDMRTAVRQSCLFAIQQPRGFYELHAPTGSGKTVSGGLFATGHAAHHDLRRVIYVAPFRTIIDQTADIFSSIFGEVNVLAHHSTADFWTAGDGHLQRQLAENWDVPFVVTTSEQFFESLFSGKPGASRKLHNICNTVIAIDEPQALPTHLLRPCMAALQALVYNFGCSVLFMSATVPPLDVLSISSSKLLDTEFKPAKRVQADTTTFNNCFASQLSDFMNTQKQALSISNTKAGALRIYDGLSKQSRVYISTWLCPAHRRKIVADIKVRLKTGLPVHVASTQVIEAGVDLDFPDTVLREKAPLDSIIQAFGRCNRNGLGHGQGYVFSPAEGNALRDYDKAISVVNFLFTQGFDIFDPATLEKYYSMLYSISNLDSKEIMPMCDSLAFESARDEFRLIANGQVHLIVPYGTPEHMKALNEAIQVIQQAVSIDEIPPRWAVRRLANNIVSVYPNTLARLDEAFPLALTNLFLNFYVWAGDYSDRVGLGSVIDSMNEEVD
jgi:CRISPR-associated endonuclease/helicase Cas3